MPATLNSRASILALVGASLVFTSVGLLKLYMRRKRKSIRKAYPKDVVILHQFPVKPEKPTFSPYCLKVETWLKVADLKYQNEFTILDRSAKGKLPYITLNDIDVGDSFFAIKYLSEKFGKDLNDHLTVTERAISHAFFKLIEDSFGWCLKTHCLKYGKASDMGMSVVAFSIIRQVNLKQCNAQGIALHSQDEVYQLAQSDLKALDDYIGDNKYFMGDKISMVDIEIFSFTAQIPFYNRGQINAYFKEKCPNLLRHFYTIKNEFWPEWNMEQSNL